MLNIPRYNTNICYTEERTENYRKKNISIGFTCWCPYLSGGGGGRGKIYLYTINFYVNIITVFTIVLKLNNIVIMCRYVVVQPYNYVRCRIYFYFKT